MKSSAGGARQHPLGTDSAKTAGSKLAWTDIGIDQSKKSVRREGTQALMESRGIESGKRSVG